jgi:hypothetical protein
VGVVHGSQLRKAKLFESLVSESLDQETSKKLPKKKKKKEKKDAGKGEVSIPAKGRTGRKDIVLFLDSHVMWVLKTCLS